MAIIRTDGSVTSADSFNTTIVDFDSSTGSATIPSDFKGQGYAVLTTAYQGETLCDKKCVVLFCRIREACPD